MADVAFVRAPEPTASAPAARQLLVLAGIHKSWGERTVLDSVELQVAPGTLVTVTGSNGTGKTTLLRIAAGLIRPDAGTVALEGLEPERDRPRYLARLGFLSTGDRSLYARLSARSHFDFAARLALMPRSERRVAVENALEAFDLGANADRRVDRLSTGQRQRVRLGMSLIHDPQLILLDEPTNSLDSAGIDVLVRFLESARARGRAIVCCAPEGEERRLPSDHVLQLAEGRLWTA